MAVAVSIPRSDDVLILCAVKAARRFAQTKAQDDRYALDVFVSRLPPEDCGLSLKLLFNSREKSDVPASHRLFESMIRHGKNRS